MARPRPMQPGQVLHAARARRRAGADLDLPEDGVLPAAANRMSHASASSLPAPRARPRIFAIVTTGSSLSLCHSMPSDASPGPPALAASAVYSATLVRSTCGMKYSGSALSSTMTLAPAPDSSAPSRLTRSRTSSGPIRFIGGASTTTLSTPSPPGATRSVRYTWVITASLVVGMTLMIPSAGSPPWRTLVVSLERAADPVHCGDDGVCALA